MKKQPTIAQLQREIKELELNGSGQVKEIWKLNSEKSELLNKVNLFELRIDQLLQTNLNNSRK